MPRDDTTSPVSPNGTCTITTATPPPQQRRRCMTRGAIPLLILLAAMIVLGSLFLHSALSLDVDEHLPRRTARARNKTGSAASTDENNDDGPPLLHKTLVTTTTATPATLRPKKSQVIARPLGIPDTKGAPFMRCRIARAAKQRPEPAAMATTWVMFIGDSNMRCAYVDFAENMLRSTFRDAKFYQSDEFGINGAASDVFGRKWSDQEFVAVIPSIKHVVRASLRFLHGVREKLPFVTEHWHAVQLGTVPLAISDFAERVKNDTVMQRKIAEMKERIGAKAKMPSDYAIWLSLSGLGIINMTESQPLIGRIVDKYFPPGKSNPDAVVLTEGWGGWPVCGDVAPTLELFAEHPEAIFLWLPVYVTNADETRHDCFADAVEKWWAVNGTAITEDKVSESALNGAGNVTGSSAAAEAATSVATSPAPLPHIARAYGANFQMLDFWDAWGKAMLPLRASQGGPAFHLSPGHPNVRSFLNGASDAFCARDENRTIHFVLPDLPTTTNRSTTAAPPSASSSSRSSNNSSARDYIPNAAENFLAAARSGAMQNALRARPTKDPSAVPFLRCRTGQQAPPRHPAADASAPSTTWIMFMGDSNMRLTFFDFAENMLRSTFSDALFVHSDEFGPEGVSRDQFPRKWSDQEFVAVIPSINHIVRVSLRFLHGVQEKLRFVTEHWHAVQLGTIPLAISDFAERVKNDTSMQRKIAEMKERIGAKAKMPSDYAIWLSLSGLGLIDLAKTQPHIGRILDKYFPPGKSNPDAVVLTEGWGGWPVCGDVAPTLELFAEHPETDFLWAPLYVTNAEQSRYDCFADAVEKWWAVNGTAGNGGGRGGTAPPSNNATRIALGAGLNFHMLDFWQEWGRELSEKRSRKGGPAFHLSTGSKEIARFLGAASARFCDLQSKRHG